MQVLVCLLLPCGSNVSSVSKSLHCFQICPACVPSNVQSGTWVMLYFTVQFSVFRVPFRVRYERIQLGGKSKGLCTTLLDCFLTLFPFFHLLHIFWLKAQGFSFSTLHLVSHNFPIILCLLPRSSSKRIKREKKNALGILPKASGPQFLWVEFWGSSNYCCYHHHGCLRIAWYWDDRK